MESKIFAPRRNSWVDFLSDLDLLLAGEYFFGEMSADAAAAKVVRSGTTGVYLVRFGGAADDELVVTYSALSAAFPGTLCVCHEAIRLKGSKFVCSPLPFIANGRSVPDVAEDMGKKLCFRRPAPRN